jgi:hypothetical protein
LGWRYEVSGEGFDERGGGAGFAGLGFVGFDALLEDIEDL